MDAVAVVTAITDRYDRPRRDVFVDGVTYIFFSDANSANLAPGWNHEFLPASSEHPRIRAKAPKLNPHQFSVLREYDYVIWVDGGCWIRSEKFVPEILGHIEDGMIFSPMRQRMNIYDQVRVSLEIYGDSKYRGQSFAEQLSYYQSRGYPEQKESYECGVMARDMRHPVVAQLGALWESQMINWSYQDQIALPYCLWRLDYEPAVLPKSFRHYDWIKVHGHKSRD